MRRKSSHGKASRREFLKGMAVVSGAATLALAAKGGAAKVGADGEPVSQPEPRGYRLTPHIKEYYEKARF